MTTSLEANAVLCAPDPPEVLIVSSGDDSFIKDFTTDTNLLQFAMRALQITASVAVATPPAVPATKSLSKGNNFNATDRFNRKLITASEMLIRNGVATETIRSSSGPPAAVATTGPPLSRTATAAENLITLAEVSQHDSMDDCWIVVYDRVYDITNFLHSHPGGHDVILENAGRDATFAFRGSGHSPEAVQMLKRFEIGILPMKERLYRHETLIFRWGDLPE